MPSHRQAGHRPWGDFASDRTAAIPAARDTGVGVQPERVPVDLVDTIEIGESLPPRPHQPHRSEEVPLNQKGEEAFQEGADRIAGLAPLSGDLAHCGIAGAAQPLHDPLGLLIRTPSQLQSQRLDEAGDEALLDFGRALRPVLREDLVLGIQQCSAAAEVVENAGHSVPKAVGGDAQPESLFLNPRKRWGESVVPHSHPAPRLQAKGLAGGKGDLSQYLNPEIFPAFTHVASPRAFAPRHLPDFRKQRSRQRLVQFHKVVEVAGQITDRTPRVRPYPLRHQRPKTEAARVILHPASLERRVLAIVAEHEKPRPRRMVHHVLSQDVDIRHRYRPDRPGRFAVPSGDTPPVGPA